MINQKQRAKVKNGIMLILILGAIVYFYPSRLDSHFDRNSMTNNVTKVKISQRIEHVHTEVIVTNSSDVNEIISCLGEHRVRRVIPNLSGWYTSNREDYTISFYGDSNKYYGRISTVGDQYIYVNDIKQGILEKDGIIYPYKVVNKLDVDYVQQLFNQYNYKNLN